MLTKKQIHLILECLARETVVPPSDAFPYTVSRRGMGYSSDPEVAKIQAKLSIMLEAARS